MIYEIWISWFEFLGSVGKARTIGRCMTCNLKFDECFALNMKTKYKFGTTTHRSEGLLDCVHVGVWGPTKTASLKAIDTLSLLLIIYLGLVGYTL